MFFNLNLLFFKWTSFNYCFTFQTWVLEGHPPPLLSVGSRGLFDPRSGSKTDYLCRLFLPIVIITLFWLKYKKKIWEEFFEPPHPPPLKPPPQPLWLALTPAVKFQPNFQAKFIRILVCQRPPLNLNQQAEVCLSQSWACFYIFT